MSDYFSFSKRINELSEIALEKSKEQFSFIEQTAKYNQQKVLSAFIKNRVSETHLGTSTGYGYGDTGRDTLDKIVADIFNTEDAIIRTNLVSGTHTLCVALFGILRPGDELVSLTGNIISDDNRELYHHTVREKMGKFHYFVEKSFWCYNNFGALMKKRKRKLELKKKELFLKTGR